MPLLGGEAVSEWGELSGQDLSFLAWESPDRPMHIAVRADFRAPRGRRIPTLAELRRVLAARARREPRLRSRLRRRAWRRPRWEAAELHIERHVRFAPSATDRRQSIDEILRAPLDLAAPPWEVWLLPGPTRGAFTLLIKIHHALVDGVAGAALLERLLGGATARPGASASRPRRRRPLAPRAMLRFVRDQLRGGPRTDLNGGVGPRRHHELDAEASEFDADARARGATRNDLVLATVAGALRRWLHRLHGDEAPGPVRAFCPVNLRAGGERGGSGNHISPWIVELPVGEPDRDLRLARVRRTTRKLKRRREQRGGDGMARVIARLGPWVARLGMALAARRRAFQVVVTHLRGPSRLDLLGCRLTRLVAFAPLFPGQRLSVAVVEYDGKLFWGVAEGWRRSSRGVRFAGDLARELASVTPSHAAGDEAA